VWGAVLLTRPRQPRLVTGAVLAAVSFAVCALTRYSTALVLAALIAAAAGAACWSSRELRHRGTALLGGVSVLAAAVTAAVMSALALPSATTTLQDTFTVHFSRPDVADPWGRLADLDGRYWAHWIGQQAALPVFLVPTAVAGWALYRYGRGLGWFALAAAIAGGVQVAAHPLVQEADRLGVLMWVPAVLGLPLLVAAAQRRTGAGAPGRSAPVPTASAADDDPSHAFPPGRVRRTATVDEDAYLGEV
jgi:hypothetical protein